MSFDVFNPQISTVAKGLEGKVITVVGGNNLGKTLQGTRLKKPFYIPFENGLKAIAGVPFAPVNKWSDFKQITKQLTKDPEKTKEYYQTLIFDQVEAASRFCMKYVANKYGVERIKEGNDGFGLWQEYSDEMFFEIDKLLKLGLTLYFIAHTKPDKNGKVYPKGDERALSPIINNSDLVIFLKSNGTDEEGRVVKSSGYLAETDEYFARSRFDYIDTYIPEFTAENLEKVVIEAIERQEKAEGIKAVTFEKQTESYTSEELDYDELMQRIKEIGAEFNERDMLDELTEVVEKHLGVGKRVTQCKKNQVEVMAIILDELKEVLEEANNKDEDEE
jgi:hypothetical protein